MFERFTVKALKAIMLAQEEARRLGHNYVGTEQILLGLLGVKGGTAECVLHDLGVSLKPARLATEKIIRRGSGRVEVEMPFTPKAKRALDRSWTAALTRGHNYIGTEHLLWGVMCIDEGVAVQVLTELGVSTGTVMDALKKRFFPANVDLRGEVIDAKEREHQSLKLTIVLSIRNWQNRAAAARAQGFDDLEQEALKHKRRCEEALAKFDENTSEKETLGN